MDVERGNGSPAAGLIPKGSGSSGSDRGKAPVNGDGPGVGVGPPQNAAAKKKGNAILNVIRRLCANVSAILAAKNMGNTRQQGPNPRPRSLATKKVIAVLDLMLRLGATIPMFYAATTMGNAEEQLPFFTQFYQFRVQADDVLTHRYFIVATSIVVGYLVLSLPFAIVCVVRPVLVTPRLILIICDTVMAGVLISAASASASIGYLGHNGNDDANWLPYCPQYADYCQVTSAAVIASFIAAVALLFLIILSAAALKKSWVALSGVVLGLRPE